MIKLTESSKQNFEKLLLMPEFPTYPQPKNILYHNTKIGNLASILNDGILQLKARYSSYEGNGIWTTSNPGKGYGGITIAFDSNGKDVEKVNDDEFRVWDDIKPEDIIFIDFYVTQNNRISEMPELINSLGFDKVISVIKDKCDRGLVDVPFEVILKLLNRRRGK